MNAPPLNPPASLRARPFLAFKSLWFWVALCIALFTLAPVAVVFTYLGSPETEIWRHLKNTVLPEYVTHSLLLIVGVGTGTVLIGVTLAWLTAVCEFPGRRFFSWALMLPLALPAYVTGS